MNKFVIQGGKKLKGEVEISGFKNAAVAILPASILAEEPTVIENLPDISDTRTLLSILENMDAENTRITSNKVRIEPNKMKECKADHEMGRGLRASYYFLGAGLGRFHKAKVAYPGGCHIGTRPIDQHIKGFEALGAKVKIEQGIISVQARELKGAKIYLDVVSVGATINIMLAAVKAKGETIIENAAKEPHIVDVANFLNALGAKVKGAGTDTIKIEGVKTLGGCEHAIIPDQIEAGTYMIAAAATRGDVLIKNVIPKHLESVTAKLREMNVSIEENGDEIRVKTSRRTKCADVKTLVYPGFPTDLQQPMSSLLAISEGTGSITENIFEGRFKHVEQLKRMGAVIRVEGKVAIIEGVKKLSPTTVIASDLRAGAALVIAALSTKGQSEIREVQHILRGYDGIEEKLQSLGGKIELVKEQEVEKEV
ncbi:UDP-N-acetylglucosamine 1-carboxyvinyltransferase [Isachenkonia alkalipeptolytica]|uniref:UDP-N-acetylglucosamine 1-carboxyvinyltransferase n=1 Tax=Isachenkonia alkalipeptolytica TaxID=2565777 RepID=A0AA43XK40_9CLOT|nr:UDP-N-acetylglucosamine 1-carboxyvinyltransferase [Isachenkonia alkalipeptolytica]NBG88102.1 UDP-N-acetylglucosamine 1-carboxyvinyltransferase [Isachenkonia alkalipeptolytica]